LKVLHHRHDDDEQQQQSRLEKRFKNSTPGLPDGRFFKYQKLYFRMENVACFMAI
jgi:hypothetical protein